MPVSLHHIVVDAHDLPGLARFWAQVLDWRILSEREREVVIGVGVTSPVGICFMPVKDVKTVKNRLHFDLCPGRHPLTRGGPGRESSGQLLTLLSRRAAALTNSNSGTAFMVCPSNL
ncbi:VOC family protein [Streptomyces sp. H27-D2]|uniref:VOC family protein n=1 Tax=Streptomyces sp. H27-D2 TaxID=3046304 RepID=UPI002DB9B7B8|nr:VOC family protein [Streptomyces sp. H27-D2]MEC4019363.1 VOC family protein [Streptomyces sp. H27-D2]